MNFKFFVFYKIKTKEVIYKINEKKNNLIWKKLSILKVSIINMVVNFR